MRQLCLFSVLLVLLCVPGLALADGPAYTFVEGGYIDNDVDDPTFDSGESYFVGGSVGGKRWHAFAEYKDGDVDSVDSGFTPGSIDLTTWYAGVGWHGGLGEKGDVVAEVAWVDAEVGSFSDDGYRASAGVRFQLIKLLEVNGFYNYFDVFDDTDDSIEVNAIVNVWRIGLGLGYETFDDNDELRAFVRFVFGGR